MTTPAAGPSRSPWRGVIPAITTPFDAAGGVDLAFLGRHARWMIDAGCTGIVALGSLGEGGVLEPDERSAILTTLVESLAEASAPALAAVAALSTAGAVRQAEEAARLGCRGLMVLPPYVYRGSWRETKSHFGAVLGATPLSCMLYNNPLAYGTDISPEQIAELGAEHANLEAVKESSADVRRITAIGAAAPRLDVLVGVDDLVVEGVRAGAAGWIAGLVNAFPRESVALFRAANGSGGGDQHATDRLYRWFLPLLRLDTGPEFVHLIKLVQQEVGMGRATVRPPRLPLPEQERDRVMALVRAALATRPQ